MRHGRGGPVGRFALGDYLRTALSDGFFRQALRNQARSEEGRPTRVRGRHPRRPAHPPRDGPAPHRPLRHQRARNRADGADCRHARTPDGRGAAFDGFEQGLRRDDGDGPLRAGHAHALHPHAHPRERHERRRFRARDGESGQVARRVGDGAPHKGPGLPRQGARLRLRARLRREQRRIQRRSAQESVHSLGRAGRLVRAGPGLAHDPPVPVHRNHDPRRYLRQRTPRRQHPLGARLGREKRDSDRLGRRRPLDGLPPPQSVPLLRRGARLEHRMAPHPRNRRGGRPAGHDAWNLLALPGGLCARPGARNPSAFHLFEGHWRLLPLGRPRRFRVRRFGEERIPEQARGERRAPGTGTEPVQPVVRETVRPGPVWSALGRGVRVQPRESEEGRDHPALSLRRLRPEVAVADGRRLRHRD